MYWLHSVVNFQWLLYIVFRSNSVMLKIIRMKIKKKREEHRHFTMVCERSTCNFHSWSYNPATIRWSTFGAYRYYISSTSRNKAYSCVYTCKVMLIPPRTGIHRQTQHQLASQQLCPLDPWELKVLDLQKIRGGRMNTVTYVHYASMHTCSEGIW